MFFLFFVIYVIIGCFFCGGFFIIFMFFILFKDICNVFGIGVVESVSIFIVDLIFFKVFLCFILNFCFLLMIIRFKFGKFIFLDIILCVLIKIFINFFLVFLIICFCCFGVLNLFKIFIFKG